jgi:DNA-directed RNA polymerase specialized sigma subunit
MGLQFTLTKEQTDVLKETLLPLSKELEGFTNSQLKHISFIDTDYLVPPIGAVMIEQCIDTLSAHQRRIIYLRYWDDMSHDECAQIMDSDPAYVEEVERTALEKLRDPKFHNVFMDFLSIKREFK